MKREEKTKLTKERILTAAIDEFGTKGYALASINNVCAAGIAKGLIYHNFENKDMLYLECLKLCMEELTGALEEALKENDFDLYVKTRLEFFEKNRNKGNMILEALIYPPEAQRDAIQEIRASYDRMNQTAFERILAKHSLREGVKKESAAEYFSVVQTMFNWYFTNPAMRTHSLESVRQMHEEVLPKMIDVMLYGILKEEEKK